MWTVSSITPRMATAHRSVCASRLNVAAEKATRALKACATTPSTSTRPSRLISSARCNSRAGLCANSILHTYRSCCCIWYFSRLFPLYGEDSILSFQLSMRKLIPILFSSSRRKTLSIFPSFHTSFRRFSLSHFHSISLWRDLFILLIKGSPMFPLHYALNCMHIFFVSCYLFCVYLRWCIILEFAVLYFCTFNYYSFFSVLYYYWYMVLIVKLLGCVEMR